MKIGIKSNFPGFIMFAYDETALDEDGRYKTETKAKEFFMEYSSITDLGTELERFTKLASRALS